MGIPVDVAELTPEWFTEVLGTDVRSVLIVDQHSGTTGRAKVRLDSNGILPDTVFCKLAPFDVKQRAFLRFTGIGVMEARFYASLAGELPVRLPRCLHAEVDGDAYIMVLEDLDACGCTYRSDPESTVEQLAHLHAAYWESARFSGDLGWVPERAGFGAGSGKDAGAAKAAGGFVRLALDRFAGEMPEAFRRVGTLYAERAADVLDLWDEGERTLIHGDPHMGNLFADGARTGFFDWAMVSRSPGMRDVAYFCCNSIPSGVRREIEHELLDRYRQVLAARGVDLDAGSAFEQYRLFAVFSWVSATSTAAMGDRWQPADVGRGGMERATTAIADLDSVGLLEERLGTRSARA